MTNLSFEFKGRKDVIEDVPMPRDLHSKIMKRVFVTSYGKYLIAATAILFINLGVLSLELYRKLKEIQLAQALKNLENASFPSSAYLSTLYDTLPLQSMFATSITAALCVYMTYTIIKFHKNPQSLGFLRNFVR